MHGKLREHTGAIRREVVETPSGDNESASCYQYLEVTGRPIALQQHRIKS